MREETLPVRPGRIYGLDLDDAVDKAGRAISASGDSWKLIDTVKLTPNFLAEVFHNSGRLEELLPEPISSMRQGTGSRYNPFDVYSGPIPILGAKRVMSETDEDTVIGKLVVAYGHSGRPPCYVKCYVYDTTRIKQKVNAVAWSWKRSEVKFGESQPIVSACEHRIRIARDIFKKFEELESLTS